MQFFSVRLNKRLGCFNFRIIFLGGGWKTENHTIFIQCVRV